MPETGSVWARQTPDLQTNRLRRLYFESVPLGKAHD